MPAWAEESTRSTARRNLPPSHHQNSIVEGHSQRIVPAWQPSEQGLKAEHDLEVDPAIPTTWGTEASRQRIRLAENW